MPHGARAARARAKIFTALSNWHHPKEPSNKYMYVCMYIPHHSEAGFRILAKNYSKVRISRRQST